MMAENELSGWGLVARYAFAIAAAVLIALCIRFFLIEAYRIPNHAMRPALEAGDTIFVAKYPFGLRMPGSAKAFVHGRSPAYGDVIVFASPQDQSIDLIKRVVGLPGDRVVVRHGQLWLNGHQVGRSPAKNALCGPEELKTVSYRVCYDPPVMEDFPSQVVPEGFVFALSDSRSAPGENRAPVGMLVPLSLIKGQAVRIWLSVEPPGFGGQNSLFSRIRFDRIFRSIH